MLKLIENRFSLSAQGARDFLKGIFYTTLLDIILMLPAVYLFVFLEEYLRPIVQSSAGLPHGAIFYLLLAIFCMVIIYIFAVLQYKSTYLNIYNESANRRINLAEKLRVLPLAFFGTKNLSDLTSTIMEDCTELEHIFSHAVPQLIASLLSLFIIAVGLFFYNWQMSLALFWIAPIPFMLILFSKKKQHKDNKTTYLKKRSVSEHIQEGLEMMYEIKSYNQQKKYLEQLGDKLNIYEKQLTRSELIVGGLLNISHALLKLGLASVIFVGASLLSAHVIDLFTYFVFLVVASRIYNPLGEVFNNLSVLFFLDIRINRMKEMNALPIQTGTRETDIAHYDIIFDNVHFSYENEIHVLNGVSFTAKQGEITALVGPSGSGKTTAAKLAARFWDIQSGKILLGNQNIAEIEPEILLKNYSVVFQDIVLFNTSIIENIRIGKQDATDDQVFTAANLAQCDEFVLKMPHGYDTIIGENGHTLSGGERQRISIARALLKDAPIILLDEATASLDVENETKIQASISALIKNKTVLIIAHRMRTIANADKIIVLDKGEIIESGTSHELKDRNGYFMKMLERQMNHSLGMILN